jgi:hypothetical protein
MVADYRHAFSMQQSKSGGRHGQQDPTRASDVRITQDSL